jgi:ribonuclease HII
MSAKKAREPLLPCMDPRHLVEVGVDESGRGSLSGPVYAAAVAWPVLGNPGNPKDSRDEDDALHALVRDSKTMSHSQRVRAKAYIERVALGWGVGHATAEEVDEVNVARATMRAMRRALDDFASRSSLVPDYVLVDGDRFEGYPSTRGPDHLLVPYATVVNGDGRYLSIAAASVLAKVHRDAYVTDVMHPLHPEYSWDSNKGYGSKGHFDALKALGRTPFHRDSFLKKSEARCPSPGS